MKTPSSIDLTPTATVLVVDDTPDNLTLISNLLRNDYKIKVTTHGEKALQIARAHPQPDLILLDIVMPGMNGMEVIRELKASPETQHIPVIFVTALNAAAEEVKGFELGAVDYITKPFEPAIVKTRVKTQLALRQAQQIVEAQNALLQDEKILLEDIINRMQRTDKFDPTNIRYLMAPVERTNGDILLSTFTPDGRQWLLVGDMTGHGLTAAIGCPLVSHVFYRTASENLSAETLLEAINNVMYEQLPLSIYMAASLVEISPERNLCRVWNAGLPANLLARPALPVLPIPSDGLPLGIQPGSSLLPSAKDFSITTGCYLYLFSDGVTEIESPDGCALDIAGITGFLEQFDHGQDNLDKLPQFLSNYHGSDEFKDDVTFVELKLHAH